MSDLNSYLSVQAIISTKVILITPPFHMHFGKGRRLFQKVCYYRKVYKNSFEYEWNDGVFRNHSIIQAYTAHTNIIII